MTADEYLRTPDDGFRHELQAGLLIAEPQPFPRHAQLQARLTRILGEFVDKHGLGVVLTEGGFLLSRNPDTVRGPDVAFVRADRFDAAEGPVMAMSARELPTIVPGRAPSASAAAPPILIEAASWLNQREKPSQPVRVTVTGRNYEEAQALADFVIRSMAPYWIGDPAGLQAVAEVQIDAPEGGTVRIAPAK